MPIPTTGAGSTNTAGSQKFRVKDADANVISVSRVVRDADGNLFTVTKSVRDADGNLINPV